MDNQKVSLYDKIRNLFLKNKKLFEIVHFFYTPIRILRECKKRRCITNGIIEEYSTMNSRKNSVFYFGLPEHNNLGDIAQAYCIIDWVRKKYPRYNILKIRTRAAFDSKLTNFIRDIWKEGDIIIFQSGYCTRYKNPDHLMHKRIAKLFYDKKMIILPQTVKLENQRDIEQTKKIFLMCNHFAFICRDKISYKNAEKFVDESSLYCFPDIVTSLIGRLDGFDKKRNGVLVCVRNDEEKFYNDNQIMLLIKKLKKITSQVDIRDTNSRYSVEYTYKNLEKVIIEMAMEFSKYKVVITDRYHGTIFSLIANTPVIVVKTNDHKVVSGLEWFEGVFNEKSVQLASDLEEAFIMANNIITSNVIIKNSDDLYKKY